jgi:hypothetical protein
MNDEQLKKWMDISSERISLAHERMTVVSQRLDMIEKKIKAIDEYVGQLVNEPKEKV